MCADNPYQPDLLYAWSTEEEVRSTQRLHLRYFQGLSGPVLDLGCGRGTMLELLQSLGVTAYGVDLSSEVVKQCANRGLQVQHGDALEHLRSLAAGTLEGIYCSHVIEHLPPQQGIELIREIGRVLKPSGVVVLATPNAKDLRINERFWLDPTHVRPYPEKLIRRLLEQTGFKIQHVTCDPEPSSSWRVAIAKRLIRAWFLGFMFTGDLVVVAIRGEEKGDGR